MQTQLPANITNPKSSLTNKNADSSNEKTKHPITDNNIQKNTDYYEKTPIKSQKIENYMVAGGGFEPPISGFLRLVLIQIPVLYH